MSPEKAPSVIRLRFTMPGFNMRKHAVVQVGKGPEKIPPFVTNAWLRAGIATEGKQLP